MSECSSPKKKHLSFLKQVKGSVHFQETWLHQTVESSKVDLTRKLNDGIKKHGDKFKYLFSVPNIITDPKLIERRKTFEAFSKNANLELYYMQLKKATGIAKTISQKADYKEVMSRIRNNKLQDQFIHKLQKNKGYVLTNELWSQKQLSQIYDQSRLKELSELLQLQKIKLNSEEQLLHFEQFFKAQMRGKEDSFPLIVDDETTYDNSNKQSRVLSRNQSCPMKQSDQSFFTREIMTAQKQRTGSQHTLYKSKLNEILQSTVTEVKSTENLILKVRKFVKDETEMKEKPRKIRMKKLVADRINMLLSHQKKF